MNEQPWPAFLPGCPITLKLFVLSQLMSCSGNLLSLSFFFSALEASYWGETDMWGAHRYTHRQGNVGSCCLVLRIVTVENSGPVEARERVYMPGSYTLAVLLRQESLKEKETRWHLMIIFITVVVISLDSQGLGRKVGSGHLPIPGCCPRV